ncbi:MAG TPA: very short patch repair endonuclease [Acidobacteriaceae bacterium]|nr:very short patch repair endonuclease [Acidobacteriaceae bacterium]
MSHPLQSLSLLEFQGRVNANSTAGRVIDVANCSVPDRLSHEKRSLNMAAVHSKNTGPEMAVRKIVHALGYRYRLHVPQLPGTPDLVFPSRGKILFVNGCFWHGHNRCKRAAHPVTHAAFWRAKLAANVTRDQHNRRELRKLGWKVFTVWQCELKNPIRLAERIDAFLAD